MAYPASYSAEHMGDNARKRVRNMKRFGSLVKGEVTGESGYGGREM